MVVLLAQLFKKFALLGWQEEAYLIKFCFKIAIIENYRCKFVDV